MNVREELSTAEARVAQLRDENTRLQRRLLTRSGWRNWAMIGVGAAALTGTIGFLGATRAGYARAAREAEEGATRHAESTRRAAEQLEACRAAIRKTASDTRACQEAETNARRDPDGNLRPAPACACQPGDPLCSCL